MKRGFIFIYIYIYNFLEHHHLITRISVHQAVIVPKPTAHSDPPHVESLSFVSIWPWQWTPALDYIGLWGKIQRIMLRLSIIYQRVGRFLIRLVTLEY